MCDFKSVIELDNISEEECSLITNWLYNWWGKDSLWSLEKVYNYVKNSCSKKILPKTFVYKENGIIKGVCMLSFYDVDIRPDIYPWLINLYVDTPYRNKKIGDTLIKYSINYLKNNNFKEVYIYTTHTGLYEKYGFKKIEDLRTFEDDITYNLYKLEIA